MSWLNEYAGGAPWKIWILLAVGLIGVGILVANFPDRYPPYTVTAPDGAPAINVIGFGRAATVCPRGYTVVEKVEPAMLIRCSP